MLMLARVSNRGYSTGFMKGKIDAEDYQPHFGGYYANAVFIAHTCDEIINERRLCTIKNSLFAGETLEMLTPDGKIANFTMPDPLLSSEGEELSVAQNHQQILLDSKLPACTIFRRVSEG